MGIALMIFLSFAGGALLVGLIAAAAIWQLGRNSHWLADRPGWRILLLCGPWRGGGGGGLRLWRGGGVPGHAGHLLRHLP